MKAIILVSLFFVIFQGSANAATSVPTTITNAPKAQFIGSMVTSNNDASVSRSIRQAVTPLNPQFKDCAACNQWLADINAGTAGIAAKFVGSSVASTMQTSWAANGYVGYIGSCTDIQTGLSCSVPE